MSILEENLTDYQKMEISEQKLWLSRLVNVITCSKRGFNVINNVLNKEEEFCKTNFITTPKLVDIYDNMQQV